MSEQNVVQIMVIVILLSQDSPLAVNTLSRCAQDVFRVFHGVLLRTLGCHKLVSKKSRTYCNREVSTVNDLFSHNSDG